MSFCLNEYLNIKLVVNSLLYPFFGYDLSKNITPGIIYKLYNNRSRLRHMIVMESIIVMNI